MESWFQHSRFSQNLKPTDLKSRKRQAQMCVTEKRYSFVDGRGEMLRWDLLVVGRSKGPHVRRGRSPGGEAATCRTPVLSLFLWPEQGCGYLRDTPVNWCSESEPRVGRRLPVWVISRPLCLEPAQTQSLLSSPFSSSLLPNTGPKSVSI